MAAVNCVPSTLRGLLTETTTVNVWTLQLASTEAVSTPAIRCHPIAVFISHGSMHDAGWPVSSRTFASSWCVLSPRTFPGTSHRTRASLSCGSCPPQSPLNPEDRSRERKRRDPGSRRVDREMGHSRTPCRGRSPICRTSQNAITCSESAPFAGLHSL